MGLTRSTIDGLMRECINLRQKALQIKENYDRTHTLDHAAIKRLIEKTNVFRSHIRSFDEGSTAKLQKIAKNWNRQQAPGHSPSSNHPEIPEKIRNKVSRLHSKDLEVDRELVHIIGTLHHLDANDHENKTRYLVLLYNELTHVKGMLDKLKKL